MNDTTASFCSLVGQYDHVVEIQKTIPEDALTISCSIQCWPTVIASFPCNTQCGLHSPVFLGIHGQTPLQNHVFSSTISSNVVEYQVIQFCFWYIDNCNRKLVQGRYKSVVTLLLPQIKPTGRKGCQHQVLPDAKGVAFWFVDKLQVVWGGGAMSPGTHFKELCC